MRTKFKTPKRILSVFLCVLILFSCVPMSVISVSAEDLTGLSDLTVAIDTGAEVILTDTDADGYYDIGTADELYAFAYVVNGGSTSINAELTADIVVNEGTMSAETDSTNVRHWTPIGNSSNMYTGIFNGNNHTVSGVYFNKTEISYVGLFGYIGENSTVENIGVINSYFNGDMYIGGVAGFNYKGTIEKSYNTGVVNGGDYVGGMVGRNFIGTVTNCYNTGKISGYESVGGVTGYNYIGTIEKSYNTGEVSGSYDVAGVTGHNSSSTITNSYNTGKVSGFDRFVGGVVAANTGNSTIINSYNTGDVSGNSYHVGGVAGYNSCTITNSYNTGDVSGNSYYVGGVAGSNNANAKITNSYNTGVVSGCYDVGGVVGENYTGTITNSYNTGAVSGDDHVGGVVGDNYEGTITNCYYLSDSETDSFDDTTAKITDQFASGEVAYLLQGKQTEDVWGQKIDTDEFPVLGGEKVYYGYTSCADGAKAGYTNNADATAEKPGHNWEDGACSGCSKFCAHTWENGVCSVCTKAYEHVWDSYSTCTICSLECKHKELKAEFTWDEPYEGECYVYMELSCNECGSYVTSDSGNVKIKESVEGTDCTQNGSELYEASFEYNGVNYTDTKKFVVESENHAGEFENGFCSACGGYESANCNEETGDYEISNAGQLYWYAQQLNEQNLEIHAKLTKDIVIPENAPNWVPINCSYAYFDGNYKTISGLKCIGSENDTYVGFFGNEIWWYDISNLHITNSYFEGKEYVGAVAACMGNGGNVTNCYVTNTTVKGDSGNVGTLVGSLTSSYITNCYVDTDTIVGYHSVGYGSIENCYYLADEETDSYDGTTAKTADQFASGEVAYLLQSEQTDEIWGQKIGTDSYPLFGGDKVYGVINCIGEAVDYNNTGSENVGHVTFENGFCTACDIFESAKRNADGCYEIANAGQLYWFADKVNNDNENFASANAILTANIVVNKGEMTAETDSTSVRHWTPIGNNSKKYTGIFNGNNYTVSGLYFNNTQTDYVGLFGYIDENGAVENTGVINSYFNARSNVGGVAGYNNDGTIKNSYNTGKVSGSTGVGGVVAYNNNGTITNSYNTGEVSSTNCVGGVVAYNNDGTITNCYNTGEVSGTNYEGSVVGYHYYGTTTNCYYLSDSETDDLDGTTAKTDYQFASGEVAYLLQAGITADENGDIPQVWGQDITTGEDDTTVDATPTLGGEKVYCGYVNCTDKGYANTALSTKPLAHEYENGFCTGCDGYEPATLNADDCYEIGNAGQLYWFADKVNNDNEKFASANAILTANIVVNKGEMTAETENARAWIPIGNYNFNNGSKPYTGTFNGNNNTISGLYFNNIETDCVGLFGYLDTNGTVENTGVVNSYFSGKEGVGGVIGVNHGTITNSYNTGKVNGDSFAGGVVGLNRSTITNCYNTGEVCGNDYVGGVVGLKDTGTITNSYYLSDSETDRLAGTKAKTADQFASGEVACLLQAGVTADENGDIPQVWGQDITTGEDDTAVDATPTLGGEKVYYGYITCDEDDNTVYYTNTVTSGEKPAHSFENGFCTGCDGYEPATLNADGCYEIGNPGQLYWFADKVNNDNENFGSANAILTANIVVNDGEMTAETENTREWTPIGNNTKKYTGTFYGNNHTVSGLYFNNTETSYVGLFGYIGENGAVENTGVINSYFNGNDDVGAVAGYNEGTITNCYNTGEVSDGRFVGGVVGCNYGTITNSYNTGKISGYECVGGVVGYEENGTITNCYYLNTACSGGIDGADVTDSAEAKTAEAFASGEVAYLLQAGVEPDENGEIPQVWGQDITTGDNDTAVDATPTLGGEKVYYGYITCDETDDTIGYTNIVTSDKAKPTHSFENGFCTVCDGYEPATLNSDGCYEIGNAGQLYWFADKVNNDNENFGSANAILTSNIVVNEGEMTAETQNAREWTPIGYYSFDNYSFDSESNPYTGTFNGNNHTVSGLYFNNTETDYVGLFGWLYTNGAVENTGVINSYFNGFWYVGGVVGSNYGTITNCYNTGEVSGEHYVGGVVGDNYDTITNSYNKGEVSGSNYVGGVVGSDYGTITNSYNTGDVCGNNFVGGMAGYNYGTITNSYNTGEISGNDSVGGVVGQNYGTITNCHNTGEISGDSNVGGVVGLNDTGIITNCYYLSDNETDDLDGTTAKTADQFESGEVAYLLNNGVTNGTQVWYQNVDNNVDEYDNSPMYTGGTVYRNTNCTESGFSYSNTYCTVVHSYNKYNVCKDCMLLKTGEAAGIYGFSIGLGGNISVKYYTVIDEEVAADPTAKMVFTVPNGDSTYTAEVLVSEAEKSGNLYIFECEVAAKEITSEILCQVVSSTAESDVFSYSVKEYAEVILANPDEYAKEIPLVKAMLNYGASAQLYFDYKTDNLANDSQFMTEADKALAETLDLSEYAYSLDGEQEGVSFYGAVLSLKSETAIKLYFDFENEADVETLDITVDGNAVEPKKNGKYYEVKISDISADTLGKKYEIKVGNLTLNYSALSYGNVAMGTSKETLKNTIKAMYAYNQAAIEYLS